MSEPSSCCWKHAQPSSTPVRRVTTPEQFADTVLFFLSPWARAVTGQNPSVDGGLVKG
jgi:3-oxoacyl-[acyl-carrier protein] reductase